MNSQIVDKTGWNPFTGERIFRSANAAWEGYGKYRFAISKRTFLSFVGKGNPCPPRSDGRLHVEDIEIIACSRGWAPTPFFVGGLPKGGEGEGASAKKDNDDYGALYQREKALKEGILRKREELSLKRMRGELIDRVEYERKMAAAAVVVATAAETWAYDKTREIIHVCDGNPEREDVVREWLLREVRAWLNAFSRPQDYVVTLEGEYAEGAVVDDMDAGETPATEPTPDSIDEDA